MFLNSEDLNDTVNTLVVVVAAVVVVVAAAVVVVAAAAVVVVAAAAVVVVYAAIFGTLTVFVDPLPFLINSDTRL